MPTMAHFRIGDRYFLHNLNTITDAVECVEYFSGAAIEPLVVYTATGDVVQNGKVVGRLRLTADQTWLFCDTDGQTLASHKDIYQVEVLASKILLGETDV